MSATKNYYHEEILKGLGKINDDLELTPEYEKYLEESAELSKFEEIFNLTNTYPF